MNIFREFQVSKDFKVSTCAVFHALSRGIKTYKLLPGMAKVNCDLLTKIGFADNRFMLPVKKGRGLVA